MKNRRTRSERGISDDNVAPRVGLAALSRCRITPLKRTKIKRSSPPEREAFAAFKAGKMKPIVRKTYPQEVVEERLGQLADHMISRVRKRDRSKISREQVIEWLRPLASSPQPLRDLTPREAPNAKSQA